MVPMLHMGYWANVSFQNSGTLEMNGHRDRAENPDDDRIQRAPTEACLTTYTYHLLRQENRDMVQHQLQVIVEKIRSEMYNAHPQKGRGISEGVVCSIVKICKILKVEDRTKFLALEIYDLFMINMTDDMQNYARRRVDRRQIANMERRVKDFAILRMGTCVQLASKSSTYGTARNHVKISDLWMALNQMSKRRYSRDAILSSEVRVMEMTGYNLNLVTALDVIEIILIQLGFDELLYQRIYLVANNVLEIVYLNREEIFENLYELNLARIPRKRFDRQQFRATTTFNKFLEGCGVLTTAMVHCELDNHPSYEMFAAIIAARMGQESGYAVLEFATILASIIEKYTWILEPEDLFQKKLEHHIATNATN